MRKKILIIIFLVFLIMLGAFALWKNLYKPTNPSNNEAMLKQGSFSGIVIDAQSKSPIASAKIRVTGTGLVTDIVTDKDGVFKWTGSAGVYLLTPSAENYVLSGKLNQGRSIVLHDETHFIGAVITMYKPASLKGRLSANNQARSGRILLEYQEDLSGEKDYHFGSIQSNEAGEFIFSDLYPGLCSLTISVEGYASVRLNRIKMDPGEEVDLGDIPILEGSVLYGQVHDVSKQNPIPSARLELVSQGRVIARSKSDQNGNYRFAPTLQNQAKIYVSADGYSIYSENVTFGANVELLHNIQMSSNSGLRINVLNSTGRDDDESEIIVRDLSQNTVLYSSSVKNGIISLDDLVGGPFLIEASSKDQLTLFQTRASIGSEVNVYLRPWAKLAVNVIDSNAIISTGEYRYTFTDRAKQTTETSPWTAFSGDSFEINELKAGTYLIEVKSVADKFASSGLFPLQLGDKKNLTLKIQSPSTFTGKVLSSDGVALAAQVRLIDTNEVTQTDEGGNFQFNNIVSPSINLEVSVMNGRVMRFPYISIVAGSENTKDLRLNFSAAEAENSQTDLSNSELSQEPVYEELTQEPIHDLDAIDPELPPDWEPPYPMETPGDFFSI